VDHANQPGRQLEFPIANQCGMRSSTSVWD
jgi:hypothetical protein